MSIISPIALPSIRKRLRFVKDRMPSKSIIKAERIFSSSTASASEFILLVYLKIRRKWVYGVKSSK